MPEPGAIVVHAERAQHFQLLVESVKDCAIFLLDPMGRIATWNSGAQRIKGYTAAEAIGKHFSIFYRPDDAATGTCELELEVATREGRFEEEGLRLRKDGTAFWANVTITALRSPQGELVGFAKVTQDLSHRRRSPRARGASRRKVGGFAKMARASGPTWSSPP
jgi:PAS domain S-box-containing protein